MKYFETKLKSDQNYREFGKFIIHMKFLYDNTLLVKYKSYAPVPSIRRTKVSDDFVKALVYVFDTNSIDYEKLRELSENENNLFKNLVMKSGLYNILKYDYSKTRERLKDVIEQYEIIKGEIEADNNNPELPIKAKLILKKLKNYGKISDEEYNEILNEL